MAQLIVRNIEDVVAKRLKERAAENGISAEEEHRRILREVLLPRQQSMSLKELLLAIPDVGRDEDFERAVATDREVEL